MIYTVNNNTSFSYSKFINRPNWIAYLRQNNNGADVFRIKPTHSNPGPVTNSNLDAPFGGAKLVLHEYYFLHEIKTRSYLKKQLPSSWQILRTFSLQNKKKKKADLYDIKNFIAGKKKQSFLKNRVSGHGEQRPCLNFRKYEILCTRHDRSKHKFVNFFYSKELLCWRSDLSFLNLRKYFANILKALHICRTATRNNQRILFIDGSKAKINYQLVNSIMLNQYKRRMIPGVLSGQLALSNSKNLWAQILSLKKDIGDQFVNQQQTRGRKGLCSLPLPGALRRANKKQNAPQNANHYIHEAYPAYAKDVHGYFKHCRNTKDDAANKFSFSQYINFLNVSPGIENHNTWGLFFNYKKAQNFESKSKNLSFRSKLKNKGAGGQTTSPQHAKKINTETNLRPRHGRRAAAQASFGKGQRRREQPDLISNSRDVLAQRKRHSHSLLEKLRFPKGAFQLAKKKQGALHKMRGPLRYLKPKEVQRQSIRMLNDEILTLGIWSMIKQLSSRGGTAASSTKVQGKATQIASRLPVFQHTASMPGFLSNTKVGFQTIFYLLYSHSIISNKHFKSCLIKYSSKLQYLLTSFKHLRNSVLRKETNSTISFHAALAPNIFVYARCKNAQILRHNEEIPRVEASTELEYEKATYKQNIEISKHLAALLSANFLPLEVFSLDFKTAAVSDILFSKTEKINNKDICDALFISQGRKSSGAVRKKKQVRAAGSVRGKLSQLNKRSNICSLSTPFNDFFLWLKKSKAAPFKREDSHLTVINPYTHRHTTEICYLERFYGYKFLLGRLHINFKQLARKSMTVYYAKQDKQKQEACSKKNTYLGLFKNKNNINFFFNLSQSYGVQKKNRFYRAWSLSPRSRSKDYKQGFPGAGFPFAYGSKNLINRVLRGSSFFQGSTNIEKTVDYLYEKPFIYKHHYNTHLYLNQSNSKLLFAKNPWSGVGLKVNSCDNDLSPNIHLGGGQDLIFFINPEKNIGLVNQAKRLKIPTVGVISSGKNKRGRMLFSCYNLNQSVHYPILGNSASCFFVHVLLDTLIRSLEKK